MAEVTKLTPEQIIDLRRRVLAGEEVTNEELKAGLAAMVLTRVSSGTPKEPALVLPKIDVNDSFAKFMAKKQPS